MRNGRFGRVLGALAVVAMAAVPTAVGAFSAPAGAATIANVATAAELATAWADGSNTTITLTADITIAGGDCSGGFTRSGGSGITVDGQGLFGIVSECGYGRILLDDDSEAVLLTGLTHFDGGFICDVGGGLAAGGPVTVQGSTISDNTAGAQACVCSGAELAACGAASADGIHAAISGYLGGAIFSSDDVTIANSTFTGNHADFAGGAVFSFGSVSVTGSTFSGNSAGQSGELEQYIYGGAVSAVGAITVDGSSFDGNWIGDAAGNLCSVCAPNGGALASSSIGLGSAAPVASDITISDSTFTDNHADCQSYCLSTGGAVQGYGMVTTSGSTFSGNTVNIVDCSTEGSECYDLGGAVYAPVVHDSGSTFTGNEANAAGCSSDGCWNEGGAIFGTEVSLTGSTVTQNSANCDDNCAAYGGGIGAAYSGAIIDAADASGFGHGPGPHAAAEPDNSVTIVQSNVSGNSAMCDSTYCGASGGGLLALDPSAITVTASTFSGNVAQYGGAIELYSEGAVPTTITNSTVTGNTTTWDGALDLVDADAALAYDTIVGNFVGAMPPSGTSAASAGAWSRAHGGGVRASVSESAQPANVSFDQMTVFATIVALPQGGENCAPYDDTSVMTSQGYNWSDDTSCSFADATDKVATPNDPQLNALGDWGGPTPTMLPVTPRYGGATSPVIDAIPAAACQTGVAAGITTDQRGVTRPQFLGCDIGAVEVTLQDYQVEAAVVIQPRFTG